MCYVALIIRSIDNGAGEMMYYCECISEKDEAVVDDKLITLSRSSARNSNAPPYFYSRAEGTTHFDAVRACIEKIEQTCEDEGIDDPSEIQGMYDLLPKEPEEDS